MLLAEGISFDQLYLESLPAEPVAAVFWGQTIASLPSTGNIAGSAQFVS